MMELKKVKWALTFVFVSLGLIFATSCEDDDDNNNKGGSNPPTFPDSSYQATINMKQMVNGMALEMNRADKPYTNKKGQKFNVDRVEYLISDIRFHNSNGTTFLVDEYHFVDLDDTTTLTFHPTTKVPAGQYDAISFTFGFDETDNISRQYPPLNVINWNWPDMLGGGYHFMRIEGQYDDTTNTSQVFKTHMGKARDQRTTPPTFENNHFIAQPGNSMITIRSDFSFDIVMNIDQWYEDPVEWDFNVWNFPVMPVYDAQKALNQNGPSVFTVNIP